MGSLFCVGVLGQYFMKSRENTRFKKKYNELCFNHLHIRLLFH